ncbi:MAG: hypothetical protein HYR96_15500 [Deltaproteobacteria bacterium]|nr:hypothetical protein [Deltaproteobacteria bacterium]MBI3296337.1 hypothetical protein [Deltaproteobacteria bacterium]
MTIIFLSLMAFAGSGEDAAYAAIQKYLIGLSFHDSDASVTIETGEQSSFRFSESARCQDVLGWYRKRLHVYEDDAPATSCYNFSASVCAGEVNMRWTDLADCDR